MKEYLLFDLDGTLTDPKQGITSCVQYALHAFGIEEPDLDKLEPFIGPPLKDSFQEFYGMDEAQAEAAVAKYRERFQDTGIYENKLYDGVPEMLRMLKSQGKKLAVASSKPQVFVERILEHFSIREYFDVVIGSELDGTRTAKEEVVEEALKQLFGDMPIRKDKAVMIGDRRFDIEGARDHGIASLGVTYGYGSREELTEAKANHIVDSVQELQDMFIHKKQEARQEPIFNKIWQILFPVLIFFFVKQIGAYLGMYVIMFIQQMLPADGAFTLMEFQDAGVVAGITGNGTAIVSGVAFIVAIIVMLRIGKQDIVQAEEAAKRVHVKPEQPISYLLMATATAGAALGVNLVFELLGFTNKSEIYQQTAQLQYSSSIVLGLLLYGVLGPIAEELLFRGMAYNRLKKYMRVAPAIVMSAICFGVYHQNIISGTYAFIMGCLIAYLYEKFGYFYIPVIAHAISNIVAYLLTATGVLEGYLLNWVTCIIALLIGAGSIYLLYKKEDLAA